MKKCEIDKPTRVLHMEESGFLADNLNIGGSKLILENWKRGNTTKPKLKGT